ncbi:MAG: glutamine--tRNA ligase/YqeY domain fusion protein [Firmicutes bacterium]|nr:glutamine--tRNA ligase/YqeY domain fusion protein [Bacillota bacterium]MCL2255918.1 glutamine--tRNA ligase/YqeY domain fusion protein [Bacillota bacterium]
MSNFLEDIIEKDLESGNVKTIKTRFPPEPNGYLHIGHAKSICLNYGLAKKYNGEFVLRFDDTNPLKEDTEYVNSIIDDVLWITGLKKEDLKIYYASDYFGIMHECAVSLIEKGLAYVCELSPEEIRKSRGTFEKKGTNSPHRNRSIKDNLKLFDEMKNAKNGFVLRAKIDMASPNMNMRDPIIYRVLKGEHHFRQGNKWQIYPMYDFAHPIEDAIEGITHSICTLEFEDHRPLYDWTLANVNTKAFKFRSRQFEFARLNLTRTIMSKRYLKSLVDEKKVEGWDDARMPTIAGLRRRGYTPNSIRNFCLSVGVAKANSEVDVRQLESFIRSELNATAHRAMTVIRPIEVEITNFDETHKRTLDFSYGLSIGLERPIEKEVSRKISFSKKIYIDESDFSLDPPEKYNRLVKGGFVRLKSAYIIKCTGYEKNPDGSIKKVFAEIVPDSLSGNDTSGVKAKGVIHWVDTKTAVDVKVRLYDYLLNDEEGDFLNKLNENSLEIVIAKAEKHLEKSKQGESFQFIREGYFVRDEKAKELVFNRVVALKDSFKS